MRQKHACFVAFHYPPEASSSGVLRTLKFSRYLSDYGWRVTVIAPNVDAYEITDLDLVKQIPASVNVIRTRFINTKRHLSWRGIYPSILAQPDRWIGWWPWAVGAGKRLQMTDPFDLVYSTSPHGTAHLIALRLAKLSGKPWVADFRDPWFDEIPEPSKRSEPFLYRLNERLEELVISRCSRVVASTSQLRDRLCARYPVHQPKISAILNGYDEADFSELPVTAAGTGSYMTILHAGNVNEDFRDPRPLFRALRRAEDEGLLDCHDIRLRFIGGGAFGESAEMRSAVVQAGLSSCVEFLPRVPYEKSLLELSSADVLLLLQASEDTVGLVPAKLYEYLRAQKPVLAVVRPGATTDVLAETGGGWAVGPNEDAALVRTLADAYREWKFGELPRRCADMPVLRRFDRKMLTGQLAELFDGLLKSPHDAERQQIKDQGINAG